ncbi:hypothetical protein QWE_09630 [Agrobacterium albertimagni AOL15]|uniref:AB hydrolase-1 domain-containing protein n=1 Tax=Agrobacterium albertimagni AOL15 TaxID=1156935 RepID=K2Q3X5_9HYPH|nr:alpha/beta fold hydrolase [Agrobacterium albertimagni]EKF59830.1 hypothetical protein QWE_09630 [Agrobacterium albertimagni AOL15]
MQSERIRKGRDTSPAIIFIHGLMSDSQSCWRHANGSYWPDLVSKEINISDFGIHVFSYKTTISSASYRLGDVVDYLKEQLQLDGVINRPEIIFVCHSMGGIIARRYLVQQAADLIRRGTRVGLFLLGSPSLGSRYATWLTPFARILGHTQIDTLRFSEQNSWLLDLDREFLNLKESNHLFIRGKELAEEKPPYFNSIIAHPIVSQISALRYFGNPIVIPNTDHFSLCKMKDRTAIQHRLLVKFLQDSGGDPTALPKRAGSDQIEILNRNPLLAAADTEIKNSGTLQPDTIGVLKNSSIEKGDLLLFYRSALENSTASAAAILGNVLDIVSTYNEGTDIVERIIETTPDTEAERLNVGMNLCRKFNHPGALKWAQNVFHDHFDAFHPRYESFLRCNIDALLPANEQSVLSTLLFRDRGPGRYQIDALEQILPRALNPTPLINRWISWVNAGYFDDPEMDGYEPAEILYKKIQRARLCAATDSQVSEATYTHLTRLFRDERRHKFALNHLNSAISAEYKFADEIISNVIEHVHLYLHSYPNVYNIFCLQREAINCLNKINNGNIQIKGDLQEWRHRIYMLDDISGFWTRRPKDLGP